MVKKKSILLMVLSFIVLSILVFPSFALTAKAATVGGQLKAPEQGWKRFDDHNPLIKYNGTPLNQNSGQGLYNDTGYGVSGKDSVEFYFTGTKMRFIGANFNNRSASANIEVYIDGALKGSFSQYSSSFIAQVLNFEVTGLSDAKHKVKVQSNDEGLFVIDAIDISETGDLVAPDVTPTPIPTPTTTKLFVGENSMYLLDANGEVWSWGSNDYGQLGLGDTTKRTVKTKVPGLTGITDIIVKNNFVIALKSDGKVYGWGNNTSGVLGAVGEIVKLPVNFENNITAIDGAN
ncbi:hypothetical protein AV654_26855 [Paenibacillus elgii]|uniref:Uncharacterized protein n=1 Tax=Paenibacillus elgii TaxID=189691 RepID=A0A165QKF4_9BACL|nr:hypothetical protein [Paenibacillus elgii]KZE75389.1 hypothetical protein AV654_26855 [Paenibacillus elgii]